MIVIGHRGARGEAPENTIAGARHAIERGVRHFEIDLRLSADMQLVVVHDAGLRRTAGISRRVSKLTARELSQLDCRASGTPWPNRRNTGVPTLDALVAATPEIRSWQLELKAGPSRYSRNLVAAVCEWLQGRTDQFVVTSFDTQLLEGVRNTLPDVALGWVSETEKTAAELKRLQCSMLVAHWRCLQRASNIRALQRAGIEVSTWTVNDASVIERMHKLGLDSVISDYPSMALPLVAALERK